MGSQWENKLIPYTFKLLAPFLIIFMANYPFENVYNFWVGGGGGGGGWENGFFN